MTADYQNRVDLKAPLLVGFFLGGLVTLGGLQGWWIAPVLGSLSAFPLAIVSTVLTSFNDNAAITYLSTLVPNLTDALKYAVVAGAVGRYLELRGTPVHEQKKLDFRAACPVSVRPGSERGELGNRVSSMIPKW